MKKRMNKAGSVVAALLPAAQAWRDAPGSGPDRLGQALLAAARQGSAHTAELVARKGRSRDLGQRVLGHVDPGAHAVTVWLGALHAALAPPPA